jgi:hypothetical protein
MRVTWIGIGLEKRANDGDYGSEMATVELRADLDPGDEVGLAVEALQSLARGRVEADLSESANLKVRRALIRQQRTCSYCNEPLSDEETGYQHQKCQEAQREERQRRYQEAEKRELQRDGDADIERARLEADEAEAEDLPL